MSVPDTITLKKRISKPNYTKVTKRLPTHPIHSDDLQHWICENSSHEASKPHASGKETPYKQIQINRIVGTVFHNDEESSQVFFPYRGLRGAWSEKVAPLRHTGLF